MNHSPLDEHINRKLSGYSPEVPPHIWENIMAEKDRKKPAAFWMNPGFKRGLIILAGILLTGTFFILKKNLTSSTTVAETAGVTKNEESVNTRKTKNTITPVPVTSDHQETTTGKPEKPEQISNSTLQKTDNLAATLHSGPKHKQSINTSNSNEFTHHNNNSDQAGASQKKSRSFKTKSNVTVKNTAPSSDEETGYSEIELPEYSNISGSAEQLLNPVLLSPELLTDEKMKLAYVKKPVYGFTPVPCPESEKNTAGNKRYFELYGGPDYAFRSISDTGNSAYLQKRKESTKFTSAFSAGMRYTKVFNNGMSFRTGFNYSQINETFKYAEGNIIQVVYITNSNGDTTGSFTTTGSRYKTTHNKFRTIDIPLLIGYELGNSRLHINFNAGAMVNLYSWQKGDVLDTAFKPVTITTGKGNSPYQFKNHIGIGFIGAVSVYYKVSNRLHLFTEPYFRYNFSPASKAELTLKQKYNTAGVRLGLRIDF